MESIVVEVPAAFKDVAPRLQLLLELAESARRAAVAGDAFAYADLERAFAVGANALQCDLQAPVLAAMALDDPRLIIDKVLHRRVLRSATTFHSCAGEVPVVRWLYRRLDRPDAPTVDPVALRIGAINGTWTPAAADAMAFLVQQGPVREAAQTARQLGVLPYSWASFHRVTQAVGALHLAHQDAIEDALIERHEVPAEATGITLSIDRTSGPFEEPRRRGPGRPKGRRRRGKGRKRARRGPVARAWRMIYCACLTLHDGDGRALQTLRYGCMPDEDPAAVAAALLADVTSLRARRPDLLVGVICDGAPEMWNLLDDAVAQAELAVSVRRLVDLWHLLGYVGKALRVAHGEARGSQLLAWWRMQLLNRSDAAGRLLAELRSWSAAVRTQWVGSEQPVLDAITYVTNQLSAGRLDYAAARKAGQPVGGGNVGATCKSAVGVRFKRCGARWKSGSGAHVLRLRVIALSGRWRAAMELLHACDQHEIKRVA